MKYKKDPVYWRTRGGHMLDIDEMSESHVRNALKIAVRMLEQYKRLDEECEWPTAEQQWEWK